MVNPDGWIVTAGHVLEQMVAMNASAEKVKGLPAKEQAIRADKSIDEKERRRQLKALGRAGGDDIDRCSFYWGGLPGSPQVTTMAVMQGVDLGVAKLEPFDASQVQGYPVFKDPSKNFEPGISLCKMGYPFHEIVPIYHDDRDAFELPAGALPVPFFPNDGIFTRTAIVVVPGATPDPDVPMFWVETSTPGLRGQSGGPTFDRNGTIWAIQSRTSHLPLGFDSKIPQQYLHVGLGVHPSTILGAFKKLGVKHTVSNY